MELPNWPDILKSEDFSIEFMWGIYKDVTLKGVPEDQLPDLRKAYICGFAECFKIMSDYAGDLTEDQACELFSRIATEGTKHIKQFLKEHREQHLS